MKESLIMALIVTSIVTVFVSLWFIGPWFAQAVIHNAEQAEKYFEEIP